MLAGPTTGQPRPVFQNLTLDTGLPDNTCRAIIQDRQGFIWLATQGGLARYDGREFRVYLPVEGDSTSISGRLVGSLLEDVNGRIWVGTILNGLCRYDPRTDQFERFVAAAGDTGRIPATWIRGMSQAADGGIWAVTNESRLWRVDPESGGAVSVIPGPHWPPAANTESLTDVLVDSRGQIWVTTRQGNVHVLDAEGRPLSVLDRPTSRAAGGPLSAAEGLHETDDGRIWIAGYGGLLVWSPQSRDLDIHVPDPFGSQLGRNNLIGVLADREGIIWLGSEIGIQRFDPRYGRFSLYAHQPEAGNTPVPGPTTTVACDATGMVWCGSWQGGVTRFDPAGSFFAVYRHEADRPGSLPTDAVRVTHRDRDGTLWVGTGTATAGMRPGGLNRLEPDGRTFTRIPLPRADLHVVEAIADGPGDRLWVGTNRGLWSYDRTSGAFTEHRPGDPELRAEATTSVRTILPDADGTLWLGTRDHGLVRLAPDGTLERHYAADPSDPRALGAPSVSGLVRDGRGRLWVSTTTAGLHLYVPETDDFVRWYEPQGDLFSLTDILPVPDGTLWIASLSGLLRFDPDQGRVIDKVSVGDGLPNDRVATLLQDGRGRLWLSTGRGLCLFDPTDRSLRTFDRMDGLPTNDAGSNGMMDDDGVAWLPTESGLVTFRPDQYAPSSFAPRVVLASARLFGEILRPGPDSPLTIAADGSRALDLAHDQNVLQLTFASLDYRRPDLLRYRYRLRGHDPAWRRPDGPPSVTYTNLAPGHYTFEVEGTNRDGVWSPHTVSLPIRVRHPWWSAPAAVTIYALAILAAAVLAFRMVLRRARKAELLRLRLAEVEKLEELDRLKSRFFANISHEFRTPLTLIEGLLHRFRAEPSLLAGEGGEMLFRNTRRLRELIDQLLDLARLESGRYRLKWHHDDLIAFVRAVSASFEYAAETGGLAYAAELPDAPAPGWFDRDIVETVVSNLLSNAIKYAPEGASVRLRLTVGGERELDRATGERLGLAGSVRCRDVSVAVGNTGSYLSPADREQVFNRFFQAAVEAEDGNVGSGIGLALVQELVELLGGEADVRSDEGGETVFSVTMPLVATPLGPQEAAAPAAAAGPEDGAAFPGKARRRAEVLAELAAGPVAADPEDPTAGSGGADAETDDAAQVPLLLVVEDNADLRAFLSAELGGGYRIVTARDGQEGLETARARIPDVIVSDVMMPRLDGMAMVAALKEDQATSHIPVVMLTAKADAESRKAGLREGADDYLAKPLDPEELRIRVDNLIAQRERLRRRYSQAVGTLGVAELPLATRDDRFLARALGIVDENLDDEDFSVDDFAREVGLSRTQLHRKLKALTGQSAGTVIRRQRLKRAAELLRSGYGNVAEVAFAAGFKSLSHFSKNFKDEFGVPPSQYLRGGE